MTLAVKDGSDRYFRERPDYEREKDMTPKLSWKCPVAKNAKGERIVLLPEDLNTPTEEWGVSYAIHTNPNSISVCLNGRDTPYCLNKKGLEAWVARVGVQKEYNEALIGKGNVKDLTNTIAQASHKVQPFTSSLILQFFTDRLEVTSSRRLQIAGAAVAVSSVALLALNSPYIRSLFEEEAPQVDSLWQVDSWETVLRYLRS